MTPEEVARSFVEAINAKRVDRISELMAPNHVFIDSDGTEMPGHEKMRQGWLAYFAMVPDYQIKVVETFSRRNIVVFLGIASGTFSHAGTLELENRWSVPAAWRVVVDGEKVAVWQLYVNTEPMQKILNRLKQ